MSIVYSTVQYSTVQYSYLHLPVKCLDKPSITHLGLWSRESLTVIKYKHGQRGVADGLQCF